MKAVYTSFYEYKISTFYVEREIKKKYHMFENLSDRLERLIQNTQGRGTNHRK